MADMLKRLQRDDFYLILSVFILALVLKSYDPIISPVLRALDPWGWAVLVDNILKTRSLPLSYYRFEVQGYPPGFPLLASAISALSRVDGYTAIRYFPIISALNVIPAYFLAKHIFKSRDIAFLSSILMFSTAFRFLRTSIGNAESFAHFWFMLAILMLLKTVEKPSIKNSLLSSILISVTLLYYHFPLHIFALFLLALPLLLHSSGASVNRVVRTMALILFTTFLICGFCWYFWYLDPIFKSGVTYDPQYPQFLYNASYTYKFAYAIWKFLAIGGVSTGLLSLFFGSLGLMFILSNKEKRNDVRIQFLLMYFSLIVLLALSLKIAHTFTAWLSIRNNYIYSWLVTPTSMLAGYGIISAKTFIINKRKDVSWLKFNLKRKIDRSKVWVLILITAIAFTVNVSNNNYWPHKDPGFFKYHYYVKCITDEEYYALEFIRENTPRNSVVLIVGVEKMILQCQAIVSQRTMISIRDVKDENGHILADMEVIYPDLNYEIITGKLSFNEGEHIYLISGIKNVNLRVAKGYESSSIKNTVMENLLTNAIMRSGGYEYIYFNDQVVVIRISSYS